jgi:hypothetical protein
VRPDDVRYAALGRALAAVIEEAAYCGVQRALAEHGGAPLVAGTGQVVSLGIFVLLGYLLTEDARRARAIYHFIMSRFPRSRPADSAEQAVHILARATGSDEVVPTSPIGEMPDTTAAEPGTWEMPRLSRYNTHRERIIYLASQRTPEGKYRYSANQIVTLIFLSVVIAISAIFPLFLIARQIELSRQRSIDSQAVAGRG